MEILRMRKFALSVSLTLAAFLGFAATAQAGRFPTEKLTYVYYIKGQKAGTCSVEFEEKAKAYATHSKTSVRTGPFKQELDCYTEWDKESLVPLYYSFKGTAGGKEVSGTIEFTDYEAVGDMNLGGTPVPSRRRFMGNFVIFENYVASHAAVLFASVAEKADFTRFELFFPMEFGKAPAVAQFISELEVNVKPKPVVCKKLHLTIQRSADTFLALFDEASQRLLYIDFPAAETEVFLESAYGKNPPMKYEPEDEDGS
jgi:hypothetical protein